MKYTTAPPYFLKNKNVLTKMNGLWIFADFKLPGNRDLELIEDLKFTDVVLGVVTEQHPVFTPKYSDAKVIATAHKLRALGVRVHIMAWLRREPGFIRECARWMKAITTETQAASGLLDAEKHWHFGTGISATRAAALVAREFDGMPCSLGVTGLSNLHRTVRPLLDVCDYGLCQAYSIWKPGRAEHWSHSRGTTPKEQQIKAWASWGGGADKPLVMGLSNYWARRPLRPGAPAMDARASLKATLDGASLVGATEIAYWSLKWLHGAGSARQAVRSFTKSIPINRTPLYTKTPDNSAAAVQWLLVQLGYDLGKYGPADDGIDGSWGTASQESLDKFRRKTTIKRQGIFVIEDITALVNQLRQKPNRMV